MQIIFNQRWLFIPSLLRLLAGCAAAILALLAPLPTVAQVEQRAGLVIVHGDGSVVTQCIAFDAPSLSGAELLVRSGLDLAMEAGAMGAAICRIDGEGCNFPQEACFCQCESTPCRYWSYWRLQEGRWVYSNLGAGNTTVRDGDVEGWRWGVGTVQTAESPPLLAFEDICAPLIETQAEGSPISSTASEKDAGEPEAERSAGKLTDAGRMDDGANALGDTTNATARDATMGDATMGDATVGGTTTSSAVPSPTAAMGALLGALAALPLVALLFIWLRRSGGKHS
uniref:DUF4430 domain-containing protein n=1 Tax=Caldilinea aerophila TaxID=133453 RepID=A0A7C1JB47_9CHLR